MRERERSVFYGNKPRRAKTPGVSTYKQTPIWMINAKDCSFEKDGESRIVGVTFIVAGDNRQNGSARRLWRDGGSSHRYVRIEKVGENYHRVAEHSEKTRCKCWSRQCHPCHLAQIPPCTFDMFRMCSLFHILSSYCHL